ncbi:hypothetical protein TRIUR3_02207 [Triticum urartu]|uniref:KIB1-4 beta-propeller domain-containing protein n=1 Tax=Triticum urartu TaxID=4572 RepID=M7Z7R9_TRIUA|nr:hypothetical protein TRIUR3_02207 [Triticum urartu]
MALQSENGKLIFTTYRYIFNYNDALEAKIHASMQGMALAIQHSNKPVIVQSDSINALTTLEGNTLVRSAYGHLDAEVKALMVDREFVSFKITRDQNRRTTEVRVLHPFTRVVVDFPPLAPVYHAAVRRMKLLDMSAAICSSASSATSIAVVVWFLCTSVVLGADPGSDWEVLHRGLYVWNTLSFQGKLYATTLSSHEILQLYPPPTPRQEPLENSVVVAHAPYFADRLHSDFLLVESGGRMLLVVRHPAPGTKEMDWSGLAVFRLYEVHLSSQRSVTDACLFRPWDPIVLHSLGTGLSERLAESCKIHDGKDRIRPSVRPYTIADHLMTYCHTPEWSKGLMFHEYQYIPESFKELIKNIRAQDAQVRIPRIG